MLKDVVAGTDVVAGVRIDQQSGRSIAVDGKQREPGHERRENDVEERWSHPPAGRQSIRSGGRDEGIGVNSRVCYRVSFGSRTYDRHRRNPLAGCRCFSRNPYAIKLLRATVIHLDH